jgi:hypothetical protein
VDERRHPEGDAWWFDLGDGDGPGVTPGSLRCLVQLVAPADGPWRFWACVVRGAELVAVIDDDVPPPRPGALEIRTEGLWAEIVVEEPFDHVSLGCEAFGLRLDPPLDPTVPLLGHRTPFGLDLGFEATGPVVTSDGRYQLPCRADGLVLVGSEELRLSGTPAHRGHTLGTPTPGWQTTRPLPGPLQE